MERPHPIRATGNNLPSARLINGGAPAPSLRRAAMLRRLDDARAGLVDTIRPYARTAALYFVGFFPLFVVLGLAIALLWAAGIAGSP
ncbi:MAG: hypothetical protein AAGC55_14255 [Myxococcota bacterium]